jgi:hypothetical protein
MIPMESAEVISSVAQNANLIATSVNEFGGYAYPIAGLGFLAFIILYFSPPLSEK